MNYTAELQRLHDKRLETYLDWTTMRGTQRLGPARYISASAALLATIRRFYLAS
jgi:hypothetical protein